MSDLLLDYYYYYYYSNIFLKNEHITFDKSEIISFEYKREPWRQFVNGSKRPRIVNISTSSTRKLHFNLHLFHAPRKGPDTHGLCDTGSQDQSVGRGRIEAFPNTAFTLSFSIQRAAWATHYPVFPIVERNVRSKHTSLYLSSHKASFFLAHLKLAILPCCILALSITLLSRTSKRSCIWEKINDITNA